MVPLPLKGTSNGFSQGSVDGILKAADLVSVDVGLNCTETLAETLGARV